MGKAKSEIMRELEKMQDETRTNSEARKVLFSKIAASGMDRKTVTKEITRAQKAFAKARKEFDEASAGLNALQDRVNRATEAMNAAKSYMLTINQAAQTMDLTGAEGLRQEKDGFSYILNGNRMFADVSNAEDPQLIPWKEKDSFLAKDSESDLEDSEEDIPVQDALDELNQMLAGDFSEIKSSDDDDEDLSDKESQGLVFTPSEWAAENKKQLDSIEEIDDDFGPIFDPYKEPSSELGSFNSVESSVITKVAKKKFR